MDRYINKFKQNSNYKEGEKMTDLVIYYTRTSNTKIAAETIAQEKNAELVEVRDKTNRSGSIRYIIGALDALLGNKTNILYQEKNLKEYDTVYIGTPVWAGKPAPAIKQFIKENDFGGVNVVSFCTMGSNGDKSTIESMNYLIQTRGGKIKRSFAMAVKNRDIRELALKAIKED